ncbi:MAG: hypothetical protein AAGG08_16735 [Actinomycetota bacterium]
MKDDRQRVVVRLWLPDRPGALGLVASRIGAARGDVVGIDVLEHGAGRVIDELTVALPDASLVSLMVDEIAAVDGVSVEHVRQIGPERVDPSLATLAAATAIAEREADARGQALVEAALAALEADWAALHDGERVLEQAASHTDADPIDASWIAAFVAGSDHLDGRNVDGPSDLVWSRLATRQVTLLAGRTGRPIHARERERLDLLARLADALL